MGIVKMLALEAQEKLCSLKMFTQDEKQESKYLIILSKWYCWKQMNYTFSPQVVAGFILRQAAQ